MLEFIYKFLKTQKLEHIEPVFNQYFAVFELIFKVLDKEKVNISIFVLNILQLFRDLDTSNSMCSGYENYWDRLEIEKNQNKMDVIENLQFSENTKLFKEATEFIDRNFETVDTRGEFLMEDNNERVYEPF